MTHPDRPDRPDRPLLPGDVHDEEHLRRLLGTAAERTAVGPPPVAAMLRRDRVRRRSRLLVAAAVVVAGAGLGLATSVPFDGGPGRDPGATASGEAVGLAGEQQAAALDELTRQDADQNADRDAELDANRHDSADGVEDRAAERDVLGFSGRGGAMPLGGWASVDAAVVGALDGTWSVVSGPVQTAANLGGEYSVRAESGDVAALADRLATAPAAATLYFADGGTVTAWTGCEAGAGTWSVADGTVSIELTRGVPLCDDGTGLLALLAEDLRSVRVVVADDGTRTLLDEDGRLLAVLRRP